MHLSNKAATGGSVQSAMASEQESAELQDPQLYLHF